MNEQQFYNSVVKAIEDKKDWWALYNGKRFLDVNEPDDGEFDILRVMYHKATEHTTAKEDFYQILYFSKVLSVSTCSATFFPSLKYVGKAKHKVVNA